MNDPIHTHEFEIQGQSYRVALYPDDDPIDPRENDNLGTMVCWHNKYNLGDKDTSPRSDGSGPRTQYHDFEEGRFHTPDDFAAWRKTPQGRQAIVLPLYLYDHSGLRIKTWAFSCPWDSGQVGWIYMTRAKAKENWPDRKKGLGKRYIPPKNAAELTELALACLKSEVKSYDAFLSGGIVGFVVQRKRAERDPECLDCRGLEDGEFCVFCADEWIDTGVSCWGFEDEKYAIEYAMDSAKAELGKKEAA